MLPGAVLDFLCHVVKVDIVGCTITEHTHYREKLQVVVVRYDANSGLMQACATAVNVVSGGLAERTRLVAYALYIPFFCGWLYPVLAHCAFLSPVRLYVELLQRKFKG